MVNSTLLRICVSIILGVALGFFLKLPVEDLFFPGLIIFFIFLFAFFRARRLLLPDFFFGITTVSILIFLGLLTVSINLPENDPNHYTHVLTEGSNTKSVLIADVSEKLKPGLFQDRYILSVKKIAGKNVTGKLLLNISRDLENQPFFPGDRLVILASYSKINKPLNPYQFDFAKYMENLKVYGQINIDGSEVLKTGNPGFGLTETAGNIREKIITELRKYSFKADELAIIQALLLGQRQEISQETYNNYAAAGVIHILAVSGLHVGIILLLLKRLIRPMERIKFGKPLKAVLLILLLWGFALLAGMSPSVVRAVSMFSFIAIGMQLNRRSSVLNALFTSLVILLLINPYYLFQVGFQLSYLAVFSIVLIQPAIESLYAPKLKVVKYFWSILTVTVAAQIGVLPLSLFYFHQFPGLFFISNLVILPFLGILLGGGILVMILAVFDLLPEIIAEIYGKMISWLNEFVAFVASNEGFIFNEISFSLSLLIAAYFLVLSFIFLLKKYKFQNIVLFLIAIAVLQIVFIFEKSSEGFEEGIIFHKSRNTMIGFSENGKMNLHHNLKSSVDSISLLKAYKTARNITTVATSDVKNVYSFQQKKILIIDSSAVYNLPGFDPEVILLINSPQINLDRVLQLLDPEVIVADGSNFRSYIERWEATAIKNKIPFHATGEKGAFNLNNLQETLKINN